LGKASISISSGQVQMNRPMTCCMPLAHHTPRILFQDHCTSISTSHSNQCPTSERCKSASNVLRAVTGLLTLPPASVTFVLAITLPCWFGCCDFLDPLHRVSSNGSGDSAKPWNVWDGCRGAEARCKTREAYRWLCASLERYRCLSISFLVFFQLPRKIWFLVAIFGCTIAVRVEVLEECLVMDVP
jgi:hypothetical protein